TEATYQDGDFVEACRRMDGRRDESLLEQIVYDGWIAQGFTINTNDPSNNLNFPVGYNDQSNQYQMNQIYVLFEKPIDRTSCGWDVGGQVDLLFGTDAHYATARGLETHEDFSDRWNLDRYGLAMPQLYMEVYTPWNDGLSLKLGHFYSLVGYEKVPAAENFFYSHSYALQYGEPITHTGIVASKQFGRMTFHGGMTRGWDNWSDNNNDWSFVAGVNYISEDGRTSIDYGFVGGREQDDPPANDNFRTMFSLVVQHQLDERLRYVVQYDHGYDEFGAAGGTRDADWFGVNQYLFYQINCKCDFGVRYEWFRDEDATRILTRQPGDYFEATAGFNWKPIEHLAVRPEFRVDWVDNGENFHPFVDGTRRNQITLACDVIARF
ncbi:MAG TPA: porin, partial [Thermoguttaceae bacterium]|nr:porin [Thermoguttaceae bacterium]